MAIRIPDWLPFLVVLPGLWLVARLYLRPPRRPALASLAAVAWLLLALLCAAPVLRLRPEIWHPPRVVLAADAGVAEDAPALAAARRHYETLDFGVDVLRFSGGAEGLRRALAQGARPNLRALLLWADGRWEHEGTGSWPAPVFPVLPPPPPGGEVQGEAARVERRDGSPVLVLEWRTVGAEARGAVLEIRRGSRIVLSRKLPQDPGGAPSRALRMERIPLPDGAHDTRDAGRWIVLLRPAQGANLPDNDTVPFRAPEESPAYLFVRPVKSLAARGLIDALRGGGGEARAVSAALPGLRARATVWMEEGTPAATGVRVRDAASKASVPVIAWRAPAPAARVFGPDARLAWRPDGGAHLPGEALRLADLAGATPVPAVAGSEPLAWAEEGGERGLLLWRNPDGTFGMTVPALWSAAFRPGPGAAPEIPARWVAGAAAWARALTDPSRNAMGGRDGLPGGRPEAPAGTASRLGPDLERLEALAARTEGNIVHIKSHDSLENISWPALPAGQLREQRARALPVAPPVLTALAVALLFSVIWIARKRLRLD